jgi:hypothetical protein
MQMAVIADQVACRSYPREQLLGSPGPPTDYEKNRTSAVALQPLEHAWRDLGMRSIVEGEEDGRLR